MNCVYLTTVSWFFFRYKLCGIKAYYPVLDKSLPDVAIEANLSEFSAKKSPICLKLVIKQTVLHSFA